MRLPTSEELAVQLGVSSGTVKNVYRQLALEGAISLQKGVGSFWEKAQEPLARSARKWRVAINIDESIQRRLLHSTWIGPIFGGVLKYQLAAGAELALERCGRVNSGEKSERLNGVDGLLAISVQQLPAKLFDATGREVIYVALNPPWETCTANFVSPDYYDCSRAVGAAWRVNGRRRVLYIAPGVFERSVSGNLRYSGLAVGLMHGLGSSISLKVSSPADGSVESGEQAIRDYFEQEGVYPDAIYCGGDILARGVYQELTRCGVNVPEEASVVGGSKTEILTSGVVPLTSMKHPAEEAGMQLMAMLLRRLESGGADETGLHLPVPFYCGGSTTAAESALLSEYTLSLAPLQERTKLLIPHAYPHEDSLPLIR